MFAWGLTFKQLIGRGDESFRMQCTFSRQRDLLLRAETPFLSAAEFQKLLPEKILWLCRWTLNCNGCALGNTVKITVIYFSCQAFFFLIITVNGCTSSH